MGEALLPASGSLSARVGRAASRLIGAICFPSWLPYFLRPQGARRAKQGGRTISLLGPPRLAQKGVLGSRAVMQKLQKLHPHTHAPQLDPDPASPHWCSAAGYWSCIPSCAPQQAPWDNSTHREKCRGTRGRPETGGNWHSAPPTRGWTVENVHANKSLYKER